MLLLVWPLLGITLPEIEIPLPFQHAAEETVTVTQFIRGTSQVAVGQASPNWLLMIWLAGATLLLARLADGLLRVRKLVRRAKPLTDGAVLQIVDGECARLGLAQVPKLLISSTPVVPFVAGLRRPAIILPADCLAWTHFRIRAVLVHELAHIRRRDLPSQTFATAVTALWWFQPLAWWTRSALRRESERACDAAVLESGVQASNYAKELLEIAHVFGGVQLSRSAVISMARRGELEARLYAILNPQTHLLRGMRVALACALIAATLMASAVRPSFNQTSESGAHIVKRNLFSGLLASAAGLSAATIGGAVFDAGGRGISSAEASLYNADTSTKQQVTTTAGGRFSFDNLPAGSYILHVEKPGFAPLYREFNVQADDEVHRAIILKAGVTGDSGAAESNAPGADPVRVPGEHAQAKLVTQVHPTYPPAAKAAGVQGTVQLEVVISKDGVPEDIRVLSSPSDDLTQSALEAVRQWRYSPTLLNGNPVRIVTEVIVNYTLAK